MGQCATVGRFPDYHRSDVNGVRIILRGGSASLQFAAFVYEQEKLQKGFSLDELIVLNELFFQRRIDSDAAAGLIQKSQNEARSTLELLHERGLIEAKGEKKGRVYHLSASLYRQLGNSDGYVRSHGFEPIRRKNMVLEFLQAHKKNTRKDEISLCSISGQQAGRLLGKMVDSEKLLRKDTPPRWIFYIMK